MLPLAKSIELELYKIFTVFFYLAVNKPIID